MCAMDNTAYIGIGSNQGDTFSNCTVAINRICISKKNRLLKQSSYYRTKPWGYRDQDDFINLVIKVQTSYTLTELLDFLQSVERELGRVKTKPWGPRTIDLDILFYNNDVRTSPRLTIPHPHIGNRGFVLIPLEEIDPHLVHPVHRKTVTQLLDTLDDRSEVTKLDKKTL
jgi:dihydroneopterin aldolase/2-amino-4-hydroxy-6-hydroxymethyldihydropteridine diphosphokinase